MLVWLTIPSPCPLLLLSCPEMCLHWRLACCQPVSGTQWCHRRHRPGGCWYRLRSQSHKTPGHQTTELLMIRTTLAGAHLLNTDSRALQTEGTCTSIRVYSCAVCLQHLCTAAPSDVVRDPHQCWACAGCTHPSASQLQQLAQPQPCDWL